MSVAIYVARNDFLRDAKRIGFSPCIEIPTTVIYKKRYGIREATTRYNVLKTIVIKVGDREIRNRIIQV